MKRPDLPTVAATAVIAYTLASLLHEGLGHGGTCLLVGNHVTDLTSTYLGCDGDAGRWSERAIEAAGTIANLVAGLAAALVGLRMRSRGAGAFFVWIFAAVNLLQGAGYPLVSPLGHFGDWDAFVRDLPNALLWRIVITLAGVALSFGVAMLLARGLPRFLGDDAERLQRLKRLTWTAYLAGCAIDIAAACLNPLGWKMVLGSSMAAAMGGTCWLVFVVPPIAEKRPAEATTIHSARSWPWIIAAVVAAAVNFYFGRGLHWG